MKQQNSLFGFTLDSLKSYLTYDMDVMTNLDYFNVQLHNLESILGDLRGSSSDFYPDQAGNGGASDTVNKPQGCLDDNLQGKWFKERRL